MTNEATEYGVVVQTLARADLAWRVARVRHLTPDENRGKHHIFVNAYGQSGGKNYAVKVAYTWDGTTQVERINLDKPDNEPMGNIPIYGGQKIDVWVEDSYPSEKVCHLSTGHADEPSQDGSLGNSWGHHSFEIDFRLQTKGDVVDTGPTPPPDPTPDPPLIPDWFPKYIYGLHEPGGENLMAQAGKKGWLLMLAEVGLTGGVGADYRGYTGAGYGVATRLNHGYGSTGTLPLSQDYVRFAAAVKQFVATSRGCHIWVIGNEPNHEQEWPDGKPIYPWEYATCFDLCRNAIKSLPDHAQDLVLVAPVAPWTNKLTYAGNPLGDWVQYFRDVCAKISVCDGFALHTYTHRHDPDLIWSTAYHQAPGYTHLRNEFHTILDWMEAIPPKFRHLCALVTETNPAEGWKNENNGWVREAYKFINSYNQSHDQKIQGMMLYRWPKLADQPQWSVSDRQQVQQDFFQAMQNSEHKVYLPVIPNTPNVSEIAYATAPLNVRSGPGLDYAVVRVMPLGERVQIFEWRDSWVRVGINEWSSSGFLAPQPPAPPVQTPPPVVTKPTDWLMVSLARLFNLEVRAVRAVLKIESGGEGFRNGKLVIRNELHVLWNYFTDKGLFNTYFDFNREPQKGHLNHRWRTSAQAAWQNPHTGQADEWACFEFARGLNSTGAYQAISMGSAQVMGFNYKRLSYLSAQEMFVDFSDPELGLYRQLVSVFSYCYNTEGLIVAIRDKNWREVARLYNGSSQIDHYAELLRNAYSVS